MLSKPGKYMFYLIVLRASGRKATSAEPWEEPPERQLLKKAMRKSCLPTGFELAAFGLPVQFKSCGKTTFSHCLFRVAAVLVALPKASALLPRCLPLGQKHAKRLNITTLACKRQKHRN